jgi:hypothetical protein
MNARSTSSPPRAETAAMKLLYRPQSLMPVLPNWSTL